jgi:hypothetical protein
VISTLSKFFLALQRVRISCSNAAMCWSTINTLTSGVKTILAKANSDELLFVIGNILLW